MVWSVGLLDDVVCALNLHLEHDFTVLTSSFVVFDTFEFRSDVGASSYSRLLDGSPLSPIHYLVFADCNEGKR
jgi:hypothetical protein